MTPMNSFYLVYALPFFMGVASCQQAAEKDYNYNILVVDDENNPVQDATVKTTRYELISDAPIPAAKPQKVNAATDRNGVASISFSSAQTPGGVAITKDGYYPTTASVDWKFPEGFWDSPTSHLGKTAKTEIKAILKPVKTPIPMVVHSSTGFPLQEIGEEYAFDLEIGELLPPHGNGKHPDILAKLEGQRTDNGPNQDEDVNFQVTIRFSNPLDGLHEFEGQPKDGARGSALVSDYLAPVDHYNSPIRRRSVLGKYLIPEQNWNYIRNLEKQAYYFRIRSRTDESGKIISANYGKIYGPIQLIAGKTRKVFHPTILEASLSMKEVYFNPTPNDRNVEFDPKRNLISGGNVQIQRP